MLISSFIENTFSPAGITDTLIIPFFGVINRFSIGTFESNTSWVYLFFLIFLLSRELSGRSRFSFAFLVYLLAIVAFILTFSRAGFFAFVVYFLLSNSRLIPQLIITSLVALVAFSLERFSFERLLENERFEYWMYLYREVGFGLIGVNSDALVADSTVVSYLFSRGIFAGFVLFMVFMYLLKDFPVKWLAVMVVAILFVDIQFQFMAIALLGLGIGVSKAESFQLRSGVLQCPRRE